MKVSFFTPSQEAERRGRPHGEKSRAEAGRKAEAGGSTKGAKARDCKNRIKRRQKKEA